MSNNDIEETDLQVDVDETGLRLEVKFRDSLSPALAALAEEAKRHADKIKHKHGLT